MLELWKSIKGYEGFYAVSNFGRVKSIDRTTSHEHLLRGRILTLCNSKDYRSVSLSKNGVRKTSTVHRLVAEAFISNPENKPDINHKDGNKSYNYTSNLEWVTVKENALHKDIVLGKCYRGEKHKSSKLSFQIVKIIKNSKLTQMVLAEKYNISQSQISRIKCNQSRMSG